MNKVNNKVGCKKNRFKTCLKDFIYAVNTVDMSESIKVIEQRKAAKRRKKRQKRNKRHARHLVFARACNKALRDFLK